MKAARWYGPGDIRIEAVPVPRPASDEVLVRLIACGVCGTDLEEFRTGAVSVTDNMSGGMGRAVPLTIGHEPVGVVAQAAADGTGPPLGTFVVPDVVDGCERCWWCTSGEQGLCERLTVRGQHRDGALAEYMTARARTCVSIPSGGDIRRFALAEPLAVAVRAVRKLEVVQGARVGVVGLGSIGTLVSRVAVSSGARFVLGVDPVVEKRHLLPTSAVSRAVAPDEVPAALDQLGVPGLDAVIECSGRPGSLQDAIDLVRPGGRLIALGLSPTAEAIDLAALVLAEKTISGSAAHRFDTDLTDAVALIADGRVRVDDLITHCVELDRLVSDALQALANSALSGAVKVIIDLGVDLTTMSTRSEMP